LFRAFSRILCPTKYKKIFSGDKKTTRERGQNGDGRCPPPDLLQCECFSGRCFVCRVSKCGRRVSPRCGGRRVALLRGRRRRERGFEQAASRFSQKLSFVGLGMHTRGQYFRKGLGRNFAQTFQVLPRHLFWT
jgi:hypothetical protein